MQSPPHTMRLFGVRLLKGFHFHDVNEEARGQEQSWSTSSSLGKIIRRICLPQHGCCSSERKGGPRDEREWNAV